MTETASIQHEDIAASPAIELSGVALSFGLDVLFKNINLSISAGESFVLLGPSGEGKSTLLRLMAGLINPSHGSVKIEGIDWQKMRRVEREKIAKRMGMLFQKNALFDSLTVSENVAFPLREVAGLGENEIAKTVKFYLEAVEIDHAKDLYPDEISGGMQKRLGIARALAMRPDIVFYDDPTAGLDPITSRRIVQLIINLQKEMKTTVVAVTNDMNRVDQLAHRVGMVVDHELVKCGTPSEMKTLQDPRVQQFIHGSLFGPLTVLQ